MTVPTAAGTIVTAELARQDNLDAALSMGVQ